MKTIAAISTPNAVGGIAMIRISGDMALPFAEKIFRPAGKTKVTEMRGYSCAYGYIFDNEEYLDDVVLTVFRAPHSYTGEDTVEITCHGGIYVTKLIISLLFRIGAEPAGPGEFTKRAFLNGKLSLSQAEAVMSVIQADGAAALRQANLAKDGSLGKRMAEISDTLVETMSAIAYWLDDAEEFPPELEHSTLIGMLFEIDERLKSMSAQYQNGRVFREGIRTVLLGKPNAGKSSVMNWLCGTDRSIVTDIAGTTRDVITEQVKIDEFTLLLSDTAGLRETTNEIESIGILQAYRTLDTADLVLYVIDAGVGAASDDLVFISQNQNRRMIVLWNKTDLTKAKPPHVQVPVLECSAIRGDTTHDFAALLREYFAVSTADNQSVVINERQNALVLRADELICEAIALIRDDHPLDMIYTLLEEAAHKLREINGEQVTEDVIDGVFSKFCVGK